MELFTVKAAEKVLNLFLLHKNFQVAIKKNVPAFVSDIFVVYKVIQRLRYFQVTPKNYNKTLQGEHEAFSSSPSVRTCHFFACHAF